MEDLVIEDLDDDFEDVKTVMSNTLKLVRKTQEDKLKEASLIKNLIAEMSANTN